VLERGQAKKVQHGHVDKVMAEEKNRNGNEKKDGNLNRSSRRERGN
jgi:hypothetical protein